MKKIYSFFLILLSAFFLIPANTYAATQAWNSANGCVGSGAAAEVATIKGFECLFYNILQVVVFFAGLAFFVMFIIGGFKYLFSGGDSKQVAQASSTLTLAIAGVIGVIVSWFILNLISQFTNAPILNFIIPS